MYLGCNGEKSMITIVRSPFGYSPSKNGGKEEQPKLSPPHLSCLSISRSAGFNSRFLLHPVFSPTVRCSKCPPCSGAGHPCARKSYHQPPGRFPFHLRH